MTFLVTFGKPAWPRIKSYKWSWRVVLGPVAFWVLFVDFENFLVKVDNALKAAKLT